MGLRVNLRTVTGATTRQEEIMRSAEMALEWGLAQPEFTRRLKAATFPKTKFRKASGELVDLTQKEVVSIVLGAVERDTTADREITLDVVVVNLSSALGYTYAGYQPVHTASWFINRCRRRSDSVTLARHFLHEWIHVAGFEHYPTNEARDDPPYIIGTIVRDVINDGLSNKWKESSEVAELFEAAHTGKLGLHSQPLEDSADEG